MFRSYSALYRIDFSGFLDINQNHLRFTCIFSLNGIFIHRAMSIPKCIGILIA